MLARPVSIITQVEGSGTAVGSRLPPSMVIGKSPAAFELVERIVAGRAAPQVPVTACVPGGGERDAIHVHKRALAGVEHIVIGENVAGQSDCNGEERTGEEPADRVVDDAGKRPGYVCDFIIGRIDGQLSDQRFGGRIKREVIDRCICGQHSCKYDCSHRGNHGHEVTFAHCELPSKDCQRASPRVFPGGEALTSSV